MINRAFLKSGNVLYLTTSTFLRSRLKCDKKENLNRVRVHVIQQFWMPLTTALTADVDVDRGLWRRRKDKAKKKEIAGLTFGYKLSPFLRLVFHFCYMCASYVLKNPSRQSNKPNKLRANLIYDKRGASSEGICVRCLEELPRFNLCALKLMLISFAKMFFGRQ